MAQTTFTGPVKSDNGFIENSFTTAQLVALPNPTVGLLVYNTTLNEYQVYNGSSFQPAFGPTPPSLIPDVTFANPSFGSTAGGTNITIYGINFTGVTSVDIDGTPLSSFNFINDSQIDGVTGAHAVGSGLSVNVTTPYGTNNPNNLYSYTVPAVVPVISSTSVPGGWVGGGASNFIINGSGFTGTLVVTFNGNSASFTELSDSQILITNFPGGLTGAANIEVYTSSATSSPYTGWSYLTTGVITSVTPNTASAAGGTNVTVTGYGFNPTNDLEFSIPGSGSAVATGLSVVNDNELTAVTPNFGLFSGSADVRVFNPSYGAGPYDYGAFTFTPGVPVITYIDPPGGMILGGPCNVTITGNNFSTATSVTIGGSLATFSIISDSNINVTQMPSGSTGPIDVVVTNSAGSSSPYSWTYYETAHITSISPTSGPQTGGTSVTVYGYALTGINQIAFYGPSGDNQTVTSLTATNDNQVSFNTPIHYPEATQLTGFSYAYGSGPQTPPLYTYTPALAQITATSIAGGGTAGGGVNFYLTGINFQGASNVTFQGNAASWYYAGPNRIYITNIPAGSAGDGQIVVTNLAGASAPYNVWQYVDAPVITSVTPTTGSVSGGTSVDIYGYGFNNITVSSSNVAFIGSTSSYSVVDAVYLDSHCHTVTTAHSSTETVGMAIQNSGGTYGPTASGAFQFIASFSTPFTYTVGPDYSSGALQVIYSGMPQVQIRAQTANWTNVSHLNNLVLMPSFTSGQVISASGGPPLNYVTNSTWTNYGPFWECQAQVFGISSSFYVNAISA